MSFSLLLYTLLNTAHVMFMGVMVEGSGTIASKIMSVICSFMEAIVGVN